MSDIIRENCIMCHNDKGPAPFPLLTYQQTAKRADFIEKVTAMRYMPPWQADPQYRSFANERLLTEQEIKDISSWVQAGMPQGAGDPVSLETYVTAQSVADTADLTLRFSRPYRISGDNRDDFVMLYIPYELESARPVKSIRFEPGNIKRAHHANYHFFDYEGVVDPDKFDYPVDQNGAMTAEEKANLQQVSRRKPFYYGWIPGMDPLVFEEGFGFTLPRKGIVMVEMHYSPGPVEEWDSSAIHINYADEPVRRQLKVMSIGSGGEGTIEPPLFIPANTRKRFKAQVRLTQDISLFYIVGHMHLIGESMKVYSFGFNNDIVQLLSIPKWDFNWQGVYQYQHPVPIRSGNMIVVEGLYDNTSANLHNPFNPPRDIEGSGLMETTKEMLTALIIYTDYKEGDEKLSF